MRSRSRVQELKPPEVLGNFHLVYSDSE